MRGVRPLGKRFCANPTRASATGDQAHRPIAGILDAFKAHRVIALGEGDHGNEQGHRFRLALIRDPRFSSVVTDVVVEFGNALHQSLMDRFISGEEVDHAQLRRIWQDTSQLNTVWDTPIYEDSSAQSGR